MSSSKVDSSAHIFEMKTSPSEVKPLRLDVFLGRELALSRAQVRRLLVGGRVRIAGRIASERDKGRVLLPGTQIEVDAFVGGAAQQILPEPARELQILAQGSGWVACAKPAGMSVHPLDAAERGSLAGAVVARFPQMQGVGEGGLRSGVLHRLDLPTSGVVIFATEEGAWQCLRRAFAEHRIVKRYLALVWGRVEGEGCEEHWLKVAQHRPARVRVVPKERASESGVRMTRLEWKVIENFRDATLLEVMLETGFLHQIRAVFSHRGYPVVGDATYGSLERDCEVGTPRLMLHAERLAFEEIEATCAMPADFCAVRDYFQRR